jgi:hypothetical protein
LVAFAVKEFTQSQSSFVSFAYSVLSVHTKLVGGRNYWTILVATLVFASQSYKENLATKLWVVSAEIAGVPSKPVV